MDKELPERKEEKKGTFQWILYNSSWFFFARNALKSELTISLVFQMPAENTKAITHRATTLQIMEKHWTEAMLIKLECKHRVNAFNMSIWMEHDLNQPEKYQLNRTNYYYFIEAFRCNLRVQAHHRNKIEEKNCFQIKPD